MKTITFKRIVKDEDVLPIAIKKGYKETIEETIEETMTIDDANKQWLVIDKYIDDVNCEVSKVNEKPNPETPIEYLARYYQSLIDNDITKVFLEIKKEAIDKQRQEEDKKLEKAIKNDVWQTKIIIDKE